MVVMEYVQGQSACEWATWDNPDDRRGMVAGVERALRVLHDGGMVHGDVRLPNVVIRDACGDADMGTRVRLVDFDWAGVEGEVRYPLGLSEAIRWPENVRDYALITAAHDDEMVCRLSAARAA